MRIFIFLFLVMMFFSCKQQEQPKANFYNPIFDQTKTVVLKSKAPSQEVLDTNVMVRSNLQTETFSYESSFILEDTFEIVFGELAIPVEIINAKPPVFDTVLVPREYLFQKRHVDLLFPIISPDAKVFIDENTEEEEFHGNSDVELFDSINEADSTFSGFENDSVWVPDSESILQTSTDNDINFDYLDRGSILNDPRRDLLDADSLLSMMEQEAPRQMSDSIPYGEGMEIFFLDSTLKLVFDTVFKLRKGENEPIPRLSFEVMSDEISEMIEFTDTLSYSYDVDFKVYYPEKDDVFIQMVRVRGDDFYIGNEHADLDERPAYKINVSNYLIGKYEVTNDIFCFFLNELQCDSLGRYEGSKLIDLYHPASGIIRNHSNGGFFPKSGMKDYPVLNVSWVGAQLFCKMMGGRLPSEAEWEYAAKGGRYSDRFFIDRKQEEFDYLNRYAGGNYLRDLGWFVDNSNGQAWAVGRKIPNELGIYDMSGNVWEWCYDEYSNTFYKTNNDSRDPICLNGSKVRVTRGGSWSNDAQYCRVTNRNFLNQYSTNPYLGFRYRRSW